jgi:phosphopantetheinyl transferase (holo-ACP synthase)
MVGNDVVDLGDRETWPGSCHARFDARVFAASELATLAGSALPVRLRWVLWAAKEAAYKAAKKSAADTIFSPRRFVVSLTEEHHARVAHGDERYSVALEVGDRYVHAIAADVRAPSGTVIAGVAQLAPGEATCPGAAVRRLAIGRLAPHLGVAASGLGVVRDGRIPHLEHAGDQVAADLSLSHHGRFIAFACVLPVRSAELRGAP